VFIGFGTGQISNSTISGNGPIAGATTFGGGIYCRGGNLTARNTTICANTVTGVGGVGGGIYVSQAGQVSLEDTLVAGNVAVGGGAPDVAIDPNGGTLTARYSLIGNVGATSVSDLGGNLIGTSATPIVPLLGPLADNGGLTKTQALLVGSPAIDAGD